MPGNGSAAVEMDVKVVGKEQVADGVVRLVLRRSCGEGFPAWEPGAHVDLVLDEDLVRQYSLCGDPGRSDVLEVAVLREPAGRGGSAFVHDKVEVGDRLRIRGPRNNFPLVEADEYLFVAGGIGITPILPMVRAAAAAGARWRLVYGGRTRRSMAFLEELADYGERVRIRPQDETGLLDLAGELAGAGESAAVYCCGPEGLLRAIEDECRGRRPGGLHVERFSPKARDTTVPDGPFEVELAVSGRTLEVPPGKSIVGVLEEAGVDVPVSCLEGTCGTCETAVLEGEPDHRDSILTDEERARNDTMFLCVSRSLTPRLRIDR